MSRPDSCPCCALTPDTDQADGRWLYADEHWLVEHGPAASTLAGAVRITSRRHYVDFAEMTAAEAASFGPLVARLDAAIHAATDAERVHIVSTRDRVQHFHAWLYPRSANEQLRGTDFLAAAQRSEPEQAQLAANHIREHLLSSEIAA